MSGERGREQAPAKAEMEVQDPDREREHRQEPGWVVELFRQGERTQAGTWVGGGVIQTGKENTGRNLGGWWSYSDREREHRQEPGVGGGVIRIVRENTGRNLGWVVVLSGQGERTQAGTWGESWGYPDSEREHRQEPGVGGGVIRTVRENTGRNLGWVLGLSGQGERTQAGTWGESWGYPDSEREHRQEPGVGGGVIRTGRENTGRNLGWVVGLSGQ